MALLVSTVDCFVSTEVTVVVDVTSSAGSWEQPARTRAEAIQAVATARCLIRPTVAGVGEAMPWM